MIIQCGKCRKNYQVGDQLAGRRVKCKACGEVIEIAAPPPAPLAADEEDAPFGTPIPLAAEPERPVATQTAVAAPAPRATSFLASGPEPYSAFRQRASDKQSAMRAFARDRSARFALNHLTTGCCACGRQGDHPVYEMTWSGVIATQQNQMNWLNLITLWFGYAIIFRAKAEYLEFRTFHRICPWCRTNYHLRQLRPLAWIGAILAFPVAAVFSLYSKREWVPGAGRVGRGAVENVYPLRIYGVLLGLLIVATIAALIWRWPGHYLNTVAHKPFFRRKCRKAQGSVAAVYSR